MGTAEQPYLIRDAADLGTVWLEPLAHYRLETSLDLSGIMWSMAVVPCFTGIFDGNGHTISHLTITGGGYLGLFGHIGSGAIISNLALESVNVNGTGSYVGGLVGFNWGSITTSYSTGSVSGDMRVGGLVGEGFFGSVTLSYSTGAVRGRGFVGGLVGWNRHGSITSSYSTGEVSGDGLVGGLVVSNNSGSITSSFWDIETSGQATSDGGTGATTAEMQTESTFVGWGCDPVWTIDEGVDYPRLWWENMPGKTMTYISPLVGEFVCPVAITMDDFAFFAAHWLDDNCDPSNDYCEGTDLDLSGAVDISDLEALADNWLAGMGP